MDCHGVPRRRLMSRSGMRHPLVLQLKLTPASSNQDPSMKAISLSSAENFSSALITCIKKGRYIETSRPQMCCFRPPARSSWQTSELLRNSQTSSHNATPSSAPLSGWPQKSYSRQDMISRQIFGPLVSPQWNLLTGSHLMLLRTP